MDTKILSGTPASVPLSALPPEQLRRMIPLPVDKASVGQPRDPIVRLAFAEPGSLQ